MAGKVAVVEIPYSKLCCRDADLSQEIIKGFGPGGLGIVTVSGVPQYEQLRHRLLPLAQAFADLPSDVKAACEHADSKYNVGWSHGKEALRNGHRDTHKGSFYANPLQDTYDVDQATADRYRTYYSPNIWPRQHLQELEGSFKQLGSLIIAVGLKLAGHCSRYVQQQVSNATGQPLSQEEQQELDFEAQLAGSDTHKARLLHYFPVDHSQQQQQEAQQQQQDDKDWCGWHLDHGSLTGLTSAMYLKDGQQVPSPDLRAGLYICNRAGSVVQATIPPGHIAYQMGQVMAIQSGGLLRATPHYVRAAAVGPPGITRNTFAVFMQPQVDVELKAPEGLEALGGLLCLDSGHWEPGMTFGEFAEHTLSGYYQQPPAGSQGGADAEDSSCTDQACRSLARHAAGAAAAGGDGGAAGKDVAPAAVHMAVAATGRQFAQLIVSHD